MGNIKVLISYQRGYPPLPPASAVILFVVFLHASIRHSRLHENVTNTEWGCWEGEGVLEGGLRGCVEWVGELGVLSGRGCVESVY